MIPNELIHKYYFKEMSNCPIKEVFDESDYVWNALKKLKDLKIERSQINGKVEENVLIKGEVIIGSGTVVHPFTVIEGPVIIGENCEIRSNVLIRPTTVIGNNCVVGHSVEIKNSVMFDEAKISSGSFVGDSIIGKGGRVASGVIIGNRRFDQKSVTVKFNEQKYETGFEKFGCILGDYSRLGANVVTAPGTLIGPHVWVYSAISVSGFIREKSLVKLRQNLETVEKEEFTLKFKDREGKK